MAKLPSLKPRLKTVSGLGLATTKTAERRITGSRLQSRRYRLWLQSPVCADCGQVVTYPGGFELDHKVPLYLGGADVDDNCQILCVRFDVVEGRSVKTGCHAKKTRSENPGGDGEGVVKTS
ncbi:MAG: HNH endonuclease signature motif containing protein [Pseudomonadota bacterium]